MLCCLLAALGLAGALTAHRLRLAGAAILLAMGAGMAGFMAWDHLGAAGHGEARAATISERGVALCSGGSARADAYIKY
jgi:hypothetical protein